MKTHVRRTRLALAVASLLWLYVATPAPAAKKSAPADNDFALSLYRQLRAQPGNLFFSPFSIHTALSMARAGARGETAAQMARVLGGASADAASGLDPDAIAKRLQAGGGGGELNVANSLWAQEAAGIRPEFIREIASRYGGELKTADFARDAGRATTAINRWVEQRTKRKIQGLIPPGSVDDQTPLVLVNAVYFKGLWVKKFDPAKTRDEPFFLAGGEAVKAPLMRQEANIAYMEGDGYQAVDLPYRGGDLSMLVLLPAREKGLRDLEAKLTGAFLRECLERMAARDVRCVMPRFTFTTGSIDLETTLTALGMTLPFDRMRADFSGINGLRAPNPDALYIGFVFHKAFVDVDEKGTEAAAATGVGFKGVSAPPPPRYVDFRADHPFVFAIRDRKSGAILFLGRVANPMKAE